MAVLVLVLRVLVLVLVVLVLVLTCPSSRNERLMVLGGGGFVGSVDAPTNAVKVLLLVLFVLLLLVLLLVLFMLTNAVKYGYVGATTDTGHKGGSGSFGMLRLGVPDMGLRTDFGWRSEVLLVLHVLMLVVLVVLVLLVLLVVLLVLLLVLLRLLLVVCS